MGVRSAEALRRYVRSEGEAYTLTDRELLHRFADSRDEAAFAVLVARHARLVLGVCRRALPTIQDAEDACQATFLILARKARLDRAQTSAAGWLYTTARRVSARARRTVARRIRRESRAAVPEAVPALDEITGRELLAALDEELANLPGHYREPLVLCYLGGLSREDAAARLGVPPGTVKTRLERGRKRLEAALARRGLVPGVGLLALAVATPADAASPRLTETLLAAATGTPTAVVAELAKGTAVNGVLRKIAAVVVVMVAVAGLGVMWVTSGMTAATPAPAAAFVSPIPKEPDDQFRKEVAAARKKAIRFLADRRKSNGTWDGSSIVALTDQEGGGTALVVLGLLEAGVKPNDPLVAPALTYLAKLPPKKTYVVSLQTQALAKADPKQYAEAIQANADWFLENAIGFKNGGRLDGWSYPMNPIADGSNTHFAVAGLHAAAGAGAKVDGKIWTAIREHYIRTQMDSGWAYSFRPGDGTGLAAASESMTVAALFGLTVADKHEKPTDAGKEAFEKGMASFLGQPPGKTKSIGYLWMVTAELGRTAGLPVFKAGRKESAWYRDGAKEMLKTQLPDGSWVPGTMITDRDPVLSTAFGLYFLGPPGGR